MYRFMRIFPLFVLLVFTLATFPYSQAQDDNTTFGLSDDDYRLLDSAISNTTEASSFTFTYDVSLSITDPDNGDQSLDTAGNGTATGEDSPKLAVTSSGTSNNLGDLPANFNREVRYVDGIGYDDLIDLDNGDERGWYGRPIDDLSSVSTLANIVIDGSAFGSTSLSDLVSLGDALKNLDISPYVTFSREADTTVKGQTLARFYGTLDTDRFFESEEFARKLIEILTEQGQDPGIADDQIPAAAILIGSMFRGSALTVDLYVSEDEQITRINADMIFAIDPTKLGSDGSATSAHLTVDLNLNGLNEDYPVEAPADAIIQEPDATPGPITATDGDTIASGTSVILDLSGTNDLVYHAANPEIITVTVHSLDGILDTTLEVYDADGNLLESNDDATVALPGLGLTDSAIENLSLPAEVDYTIRISSFSGAESGEVEVSVTATTGQTVSPVLDGKVLLVTEPLKVYLSGQEPIDLAYQVTGQEIISIYVTSLDINPIPVDTTLEILDSDGDQVAYNDDLVSGNVDPGLENLELGTGVYTIRLNTYDTSEVGGVQVELFLGEVEAIGDGVGDGFALSYGDSTDGTITDTSLDSYTFEGSGGDTITIQAEATNPASPDQDLQLTLYRAEGEFLTSDDDSGESMGLGDRDPAIISFTLPADGEYRIEVDSLFDTSGDYTISLELD